jgi:hypothetical protein
MVARLKLKEIDGKAPPGVNAVTLRLKATPKRGGGGLQTLVELARLHLPTAGTP